MYVVAGATGHTGRAAAERLLAAGKPVRVLLRDPADAPAWTARGAGVAIADLGDEAALAAALDGAEGAYFLVPPAMAAPDFLEDRRRLARSIARAVSASAVPRIALLSSVGGHLAEGTGLVLATHIGEEIVAPAAPNATIVRSAYFLENWAPVLETAREAGVLPSFLAPERKIPMVSAADTGRAAAEALLEARPGRRVIEIAGRENWSPADLAGVLAAILRRDVRVEAAPTAAAVPVLRGFGASEDVARLAAAMYEAINAGRVAFDGTGERRRGETPPAAVFAAALGI